MHPNLTAKIRFYFQISLLLSIVFFCGCGNFFEKKPTEIETRQILSELEQVKESPFVANPLPELYTSEPKIVSISDGYKVFYFSKQTPVADLSDLLITQMNVRTSVNPATNQIIIQCRDEDEAYHVLDFLELIDVPPIQVNIDCIVLERFADVTMDWETTLLMENFLGEGITFGADKFPNPAFPGAALRESRRSTFGLDVGYWRNQDVSGHQFRAVLDMLISRGYLKILMNPTLETVNGKTATITSQENAPIEKIVTGEDIVPYSLTDYQWVIDSLTVTPHVFSDGSIGLSTEIKIGSRSKPEGVVQQSIITERSTKIEENRIEPGDSLIIGGIRKSEQRSVIRGLPFFKDLPIIGNIFSSKDYEEKGTEIIFILTPSISSNGMKHSKMTEEIRRKYKSPEYKPELEKMFTDPFTKGIYTEHAEKKAAEAEYLRTMAEIEKAHVEEEIELLKEELIKEAEKARLERERADQAREKADEALKKVNEASSKLKEEQQKAKQATEQLKQEQQKVEDAIQQSEQFRRRYEDIKKQQKTGESN